MQYTSVSALLVALLATNTIAAPLTKRTPKSGFDGFVNGNSEIEGDQSLVGQACTDGTFDGVCRADGRCALEQPVNEISLEFVKGQCGVADDDADADAGDDANAGGSNNGNNGDAGNTGNAGNADNTGNNGNTASFEGQACTDGTFNGTCRDDGRCALEQPINEISLEFVDGQCGVADDNVGGNTGNNGNNGNAGNTGNTGNTGNSGNAGNTGNKGNVASFEGQPCTDGSFNGFCGADGRCGLNLPVNEFSREFVRGQCGR
ncbi:hypothetical protein F5Y04DRAFT_275528 [Hypomontagnella monticulosa]|nr:hypothetical protein F5Y04DRAFT_275528 [Hypomontagnella monticulosa]